MNYEFQTVAERLGLSATSVKNTADLLAEGCTVPFIARYRKERTGSLDEVQIREIEATLKAVRELDARRQFVREAIEAAGALTPELARRLDAAQTMTEVEDIYLPFKPKKRTRATIAREKGLEPLAKMIMSGSVADPSAATARFVGKNGVADAQDALAGASDIIAEWASESTRLRNMTRNTYRRTGAVACSVVKGKEAELAATPFAQYGDFSKNIRQMSSHQYLALRRAEREGLVKVKYQLSERDGSLEDALARAFTPGRVGRGCAEVIADAVADASKRLLRPSVENEISAELKEEADRVAIDIFAGNLRQLLLAAPLKGKRVLALDPGYRTGCKVVALDAQGNLLDDTVIYPVPPKSDLDGAARTLSRLIARHGLEVVALGNGTASRETEKFLKDYRVIDPARLFVVSESGASVYSASDIARREFPDKDVTVRGAVSIGRRLIDPLAELVKIDPKSIGVGQYQHDVDQSKLKDALDFTVMSCVNAVGIDVNTASEKLLSYVSGIGPALAANIVAYRAANGDFTSRAQLKKVPRLGDKAFQLAAGFLRVPGSREPLDNTGIHPESYDLVKRMAASIGARVADLPANAPLLSRLDLPSLARTLASEASSSSVAGLETMTDIVEELKKPGRDPRTEDNVDAFIPGVNNFEELVVGQELPGIVNNITAFGAFIDLGIKENALIHISKMKKGSSATRVTTVSDVLKLAQRVKVRVIDLDPARRRISLELL